MLSASGGFAPWPPDQARHPCSPCGPLNWSSGSASAVTWRHMCCITDTSVRVICCRQLGAWSDMSRQHNVCCLWWVLHNPSVRHTDVQWTWRSHWRQRNGRSMGHHSLSWQSSAVRRWLGCLGESWLYLASVSWWSLVRQVAADWRVNNAQTQSQQAISDVTASASDVITSQSTSIQHNWQTTAACRWVAAVCAWSVSRSRNDTWHVCRQSLRHSTVRVAVRGE